MTQLFGEGTTPNENSAGGGDRTHTILRSLDFESSASASSATPAPGTQAFCLFLGWQQPRAESRTGRTDSQAYVAISNGCKLRGGPKTSRRIMAFRSADVEPNNCARSVAAVGVSVPVAVDRAELSSGVSIEAGCACTSNGGSSTVWPGTGGGFATMT